jgi:hypothetical protein
MNPQQPAGFRTLIESRLESDPGAPFCADCQQAQ